MTARKSEVYSWRLTSDLKWQLEERARDEGIGLAALLERIARDWLRAKATASSDEAREQARIKAAAMRTVGTLHGHDPRRSEQVRERARARLARLRAR